MRIGIIGAGAIASYLLEQLNKKKKYPFTISSMFVRNKEKYSSVGKNYNVTLYSDFKQFLNSSMDVVIEAATIDAAQRLVPKALELHDVIVISIGAFSDKQFLEEIELLSKQNETNVYVPSGAIGGLDIIQNARAAGTLESVSLTTTKPAHTLTEESLTEARVVFEGSARKAIQLFPKNVNVSIALGLAGVGFEETIVKLVADPSIDKNIHQIEGSGSFGEITCTIENEPLPTNPKSSYLAAISIIGVLTKRANRIVIG